MVTIHHALSGFSVDDIGAAERFYGEIALPGGDPAGNVLSVIATATS